MIAVKLKAVISTGGEELEMARILVSRHDDYVSAMAVRDNRPDADSYCAAAREHALRGVMAMFPSAKITFFIGS